MTPKDVEISGHFVTTASLNDQLNPAVYFLFKLVLRLIKTSSSWPVSPEKINLFVIDLSNDFHHPDSLIILLLLISCQISIRCQIKRAERSERHFEKALPPIRKSNWMDEQFLVSLFVRVSKINEFHIFFKSHSIIKWWLLQVSNDRYISTKCERQLYKKCFAMFSFSK